MVDDRNHTGVRELLAANLRRMRVARHLSLSELARATGMSKATVSGIEGGRANPTVETLAGLAAALGVSIGELLERAPVGEIRIVRAVGAESAGAGESRRVLDALGAGASTEVAELALARDQRIEMTASAGGARASVYVRVGKLIAGPLERHTELVAGDFASFPADVPHVYEAVRQPVRALLLVQTPF